TAWLRRYQLSSGAYRDTRLQPPDWDGWLHSAVFSPDLRRLVAGGIHNPWPVKGEKLPRRRRGMWFWDTQTGKLLGKPKRFPEGTVFHDLIYTFRPDSRALAVAITTITPTTTAGGKVERIYSNPLLQLLDVPNAQVLKEFEFPKGRVMLHSIAFNPFGDLLACIDNHFVLELRDVATGKVRGPPSPIYAAAAAFSADGKRLFVGYWDGTAKLWELDALLSAGEK
ncbi:MAG: WD40 repeat domain-containing protein, partial [Pirellulales bacterium]